MELSGALSRTYHPKYTHYAPDGIGRDQYITTNNGGLLSLEGMIVP